MRNLICDMEAGQVVHQSTSVLWDILNTIIHELARRERCSEEDLVTDIAKNYEEDSGD